MDSEHSPTALPGVPLLHRAQRGKRRLGGLSTAVSTLPAPRVCTPGCQGGAAINYPGSYSRRVGEAARIHTPVPGQVQSGPDAAN